MDSRGSQARAQFQRNTRRRQYGWGVSGVAQVPVAPPIFSRQKMYRFFLAPLDATSALSAHRPTFPPSPRLISLSIFSRHVTRLPQITADGGGVSTEALATPAAASLLLMDDRAQLITSAALVPRGRRQFQHLLPYLRVPGIEPLKPIFS